MKVILCAKYSKKTAQCLSKYSVTVHLLIFSVNNTFQTRLWKLWSACGSVLALVLVEIWKMKQPEFSLAHQAFSVWFDLSFLHEMALFLLTDDIW